MKIIKSLLIQTTAILAVCATPCNALIINPILNLDIEGIRYDVTFHTEPTDSFNSLWDQDQDDTFGGGSSLFSTQPTFWGDETGAAAARNAITSYLSTTDTTTATSDSFAVPCGVVGLFPGGPCEETTLGINTTLVIDVAYDSNISSTIDIADFATLSGQGFGGVDTYPFVSFSTSSTDIPAPLTLSLMLLGGVILLWRPLSHRL